MRLVVQLLCILSLAANIAECTDDRAGRTDANLGVNRNWPLPWRPRRRPRPNAANRLLILKYGGFNPQLHDDGFNENFNPGLADLRGKIACVGPLPDWAWPADLSFDVRPFSLQNICAKPQYGGNQEAHIGGWCFRRDEVDPGDVAFDPSNDARVNRKLDSLRLKAYCMQQCFCDPFAGSTTEQPRWKSYIPEQEVAIGSYYLDIEQAPDWPPLQLAQSTSLEMTHTLTVRQQKQVRDPENPPYGFYQTVTIPEEKSVECEGDFPPWALPSPWTKDDYDHLHEACVSVYNGGNVHANAGGVCLPGASLGIPTSKIAHFTPQLTFLNELTPSEAFRTPSNTPISSRSSNLAAVAFRFYCVTKCRCRFSEEPEDSENSPTANTLFKGTMEMKITLPENGGLKTRLTDTATGRVDETSLFPARGGASSAAIGPQGALAVVRNFFQDSERRVGHYRHGSCGLPCRTAGDCVSSGNDYGEKCQCIIATPPGSFAGTGKMGMGLSATCMTVASALLISGKNRKGGSSAVRAGVGLFRRDSEWVIAGGENWDGWGCLCNATHAARSCCGAGTVPL